MPRWTVAIVVQLPALDYDNTRNDNRIINHTIGLPSCACTALKESFPFHLFQSPLSWLICHGLPPPPSPPHSPPHPPSGPHPKKQTNQPTNKTNTKTKQTSHCMCFSVAVKRCQPEWHLRRQCVRKRLKTANMVILIRSNQSSLFLTGRFISAHSLC